MELATSQPLKSGSGDTQLNPSTWKDEAERSGVQDQPGLHEIESM